MRSWEVAYKDIIPADFIIEKNATRQAQFKESITIDNNDAYVIQYGEKTIGILRASLPLDDDMGDDAYELYYIYLHPDFCKMGIGTRAMEFAFDKARNMGKRIMTVWVFAENVNSIRFYEKCGFSADGKRAVKDYGRNIEAVRMIKYL
jgi:ribosomal protein S18 acetylase RimI-like enzyme